MTLKDSCPGGISRFDIERSLRQRCAEQARDAVVVRCRSGNARVFVTSPVPFTAAPKRCRSDRALAPVLTIMRGAFTLKTSAAFREGAALGGVLAGAAGSRFSGHRKISVAMSANWSLVSRVARGVNGNGKSGTAVLSTIVALQLCREISPGRRAFARCVEKCLGCEDSVGPAVHAT